jgi:hypothetical protein
MRKIGFLFYQCRQALRREKKDQETGKEGGDITGVVAEGGMVADVLAK